MQTRPSWAETSGHSKTPANRAGAVCGENSGQTETKVRVELVQARSCVEEITDVDGDGSPKAALILGLCIRVHFS